jgi:phage terminase small subunit
MPRGSQGRLVRFARELASGKKPREAAIAAGYPPGSSFDSNARKRARRDDVKRMVEEFRAPIAEKMEITLTWLIEENLQLYRAAKAAGQLRDAREGLKELGVLSGKRIERSEHGEPGEFERMSDEELWKDLTERARALGFEPPPETQH